MLNKTIHEVAMISKLRLEPNSFYEHDVAFKIELPIARGKATTHE